MAYVSTGYLSKPTNRFGFKNGVLYQCYECLTEDARWIEWRKVEEIPEGERIVE